MGLLTSDAETRRSAFAWRRHSVARRYCAPSEGIQSLTSGFHSQIGTERAHAIAGPATRERANHPRHGIAAEDNSLPGCVDRNDSDPVASSSQEATETFDWQFPPSTKTWPTGSIRPVPDFCDIESPPVVHRHRLPEILQG